MDKDTPEGKNFPRPSKVVRFSKDDFNPIVFGEKTLVIYRDKDKKCEIFDEETFLGDFGDGTFILLKAVGSNVIYDFRCISDITAMEAGFANQKDLFASIEKNDPEWKETERAVVVRFKMVEQSDGTPIYFERS